MVENENYSMIFSQIHHLLEVREIDINPDKFFELDFDFSDLIVLPLVGNCRVQVESEKLVTVDSNEILSLHNSSKPNKIRLSNPYNQLVKILVICFENKVSHGLSENIKSVITFNNKNEWAKISNLDFINIGVFGSRYEDIVKNNIVLPKKRTIQKINKFELENEQKA
ncbi:MAG: hypothetical protein H6607_05145 [Flavobacteriales bacterium]|nr:hypothetical protein [Flavobacteriales bacterium]